MMRQERENRTPLSVPASSALPEKPRNAVPVQYSGGSSAPLSEEAKALQAGDTIEHERFGRGKVISVEQDDGNRRAFVDFESAGQKQLLLKYAKFRIVGKE